MSAENGTSEGSAGSSEYIGTLSEQSQRIICNVHEYFKKIGKRPICEAAKAVGISRQTVSKIVRRGPKAPKKKGNKNIKFGKLDEFTCDEIRREVYKFIRKGRSPTVAELLAELQKSSNFPYKETTLRQILKKLGFRFRTLNVCKCAHETIEEETQDTALDLTRVNRSGINVEESDTEDEDEDETLLSPGLTRTRMLLEAGGAAAHARTYGRRTPALAPNDVATAMDLVLTQPPNVQVEEIVITPLPKDTASDEETFTHEVDIKQSPPPSPGVID